MLVSLHSLAVSFIECEISDCVAYRADYSPVSVHFTVHKFALFYHFSANYLSAYSVRFALTPEETNDPAILLVLNPF